jgi:TonB family protein
MRRLQNPGAAVLLALVLSFSSIAQAQQLDDPVNTTAHGVDLYRQGKLDEAIKVLLEVVKKHEDDAEAWYYLGLAQFNQEWFGGAREAFEKTVELRPSSADAHAKLAYALILGNEPKQALAMARRALELGDQSVESHYAIAEASLRLGEPGNALEEAAMALKIKPDFLPPLITKSFAHYSLRQYSESAASLERFLALSPNDPDAPIWRDQLEELRSRTSQKPGDPAPAFAPREVTQKVRVLSKPEPGYTERARKAGVMGTVVLVTVFSSEGEVKNIRIVKALGYGLTTKAIGAARQIKFSPAIKDGKPVSMFMQLEYSFNLY